MPNSNRTLFLLTSNPNKDGVKNTISYNMKYAGFLSIPADV